MKNANLVWYLKGIRNGWPIGVGYFAVSFAVGIAARNVGFTAVQATAMSMLINASAGEFAAITLAGANASLLEAAVMELIANARYLLMSFSLSQKLPPGLKLRHRLLLANYITDEIFGLSVAVPGMLNPFYTYGVISVASPGWAIGTALGVVMGNILPDAVVSALSVSLYGMFLAIIVPPGRKNHVIALLVTVSMLTSLLAETMPLTADIPSGVRIILLTLVLSLAAAVLFPIKEDGAPEKEAV